MSSIGRYEVESELGRGASGVVYLAHDPRVQRPVAAKAFAMPAGLSADEAVECRERFLREARAAGSLSHPGIVTIYDADFDEERGVPFIAMEYVPGRSLQAALREVGTLPVARAVDLTLQLAGALAAAHLAGVIHRDVKPANVLLRDDDTRAKLADFGVARLSASDLTRSGATVGSPAYMSPEQIRGGEIDGRSDLFSLAVILYEAIAGRRPFRGDDVAALAYSIVHEPPLQLGGRVPGVTAALDRFLERALAKRPADRFQNAAEFGAALRRATGARANAVAAAADPFDSFPNGTRPAEVVAPDAIDGGATRTLPSLQSIAVVAALLLVVGVGGRALLGTGPRAEVDVEARSMVRDGRVTVLVDGRRAWASALELPEAPQGRLQRVFRQRSEALDGSFSIRAGERRIEVRLERDGEPTITSEPLVATFEGGEQRRLSLVLGRARGGPVTLALH